MTKKGYIRFDSVERARIMEEFYLLCAIRFGMGNLKYPADHEVFGKFREELYPDYFSNDAIPCMDLMSYLIWCKGKQEESNG